MSSFALIERCRNQRLSEFVEKVQHPIEVMRTYEDKGLHVVLAQNVRDNSIEFNERVFMSPKLKTVLAANRLEYGDVLMTRSGANYGQAASWHEKGEAFACADLLVFRRPGCPSGYLSTFFCTQHGKRIIERGAYGMAQPHIAPTYLEQIAVPRFGALEQEVDGLVSQSAMLKHEQLRLVSQAEQTLLEALGLENWYPPEPLTYTRSVSEALSAARFDAEFFAPARYATVQKLAEKPHRVLSECCDSIRDLFDPTDPKGPAHVRNFDLGEALRPILDDSMPPMPRSEIGSTKKMMMPGDVVISRLRSYLRQVAVVRTAGDVPTVGSSEFIVLRPRKGIAPELLMVFLRSRPVQTILRYCQEGNQHPRFSENNLLQIPFPILSDKQVAEIIAHVRQAHAARQQAQGLLEKAKRSVEIAIEEGEAAAREYLA